MSGRKVVILWVCVAIVLSGVVVPGAIGGTVAAANDAEFQVTSADIEAETVAAGEEIEITASVENVGNRSGTFTAELETAEDGVIGTKDIEVDAGETETVEFTETFDEGTYEISVSGESAGELTVTEPASAEFEVDDVELSSDEIVAGESVDVTAEVENDGDANGTFTAELQVDGEVVETKRIDVVAGESESVGFTRSFDETGTYDVGVNGESAGELTVTEPATANISVAEATLTRSEIDEGGSTTITAIVENAGRADGAFTAELQVDGEVVDTKRVDVAAGVTEPVTFARTFDEAGTYDVAVSGEFAGELTVTEPASPDISVTDAGLSTSEIDEGGSVTVTATVENAGDAAGEFTVRLRVDDEAVDSRIVDVAAGGSETVEFTQTFDETGTYDVAINSESAGELTVTEPASPDISVTDAGLSDSEIEQGGSVTVTATVENTGQKGGSFTAELQVDGEVVDTKRVGVGPGKRKTVQFTRTFDRAGTYDIAVSGERAGELTVTEPATPDISVTDARLSESEIDEGGSVTIAATVENVGDAAGEFTADLRVDGTAVDSRTVDVDAGETMSIDFTRTFDEADTYEIAVSGEPAGELTVSAPDPAAFEVSNARLDDDTILEGERAVLSADVTNTGEQEGTFTAEFRATGDDGRTEVVDSRDVTLAGGASETVELSATFDGAGEYGVQFSRTDAGTLTVESPADPTVTDATLEDAVVSDGEAVAVTATVENTGDRAGDLSVAVAADGSEKTTEAVTVGPGERTTERLTYTATEYGTYEITVNGVRAGTLTVVQPATFRTTNPDLGSETVLEDESVAASATVINVGSEAGTHTATLFVDDESVDGTEIVLGPGDSETVTFSRTFDEAGEYAVAIDDASAGAVTVLEPADVSIRNTDLSKAEIVAGGSATVTVELENDGDVEGEFETRLHNGNDTLETVTRTVGPDATETVTFDRAFEATGEYDLAVNDAPVGTLSVLEPADVSLGGTSLDTDSVEVNESVRLTVELRNGGEATGQRAVDVALGDGTDIRRTADVPENGTTLTVDHTYEEPGEYTVSVDGTTVETVTVVDPDAESSGSSGGTSSSGPSGSSGSSGSPSSSGSTGGAPTGGSSPTVVRSESAEAVTVSVDGVNGEPYDFSVGLTGPSGTENVSLSTFAIEPAGDRDAFEATVGRPTADPGNRTAVPHGTVLGYVTADSTLEPTETRVATLEFDLNRGAIPEALGPDDVAVMRYASDEWTTRNVTHEADGDGHRATLSRAAPVAIVALEPGGVEVVDAELPADQVRIGYATTLRATVRNPGDRPANRTLAVTMGGESVAEREVSLAPNETATVRIEFEPSGSGTVALNGSEVGSITTFGEDASETSTEPRTEESAPGFGVVVALLALLAVTLAARAGRR